MGGYDASNSGNHREATVPTSDPEQLWSHGFGNLVLRTGPVVHDGLVLVGTRGDPTHQGPFRLYAFEAAMGEHRWSHDISRGLFSAATPAAVDGTVYVRVRLSTGTLVEALDVSDGSRRWQRTVNDWIVGPFVVSDGRLYVTMDEAMLALDPENGEQLWRTAVEPVMAQPAVGDGAVHVGCQDGCVRAFEATSGEKRWSYDLGDELTTSTAIRDGLVYAGGRDHLVALRDGEEAWRFGFEDDERFLTSTAPAVDGEQLYVGGRRSIYALDGETGAESWTHELGRTDRVQQVPPSVAEQTVVFGISDGVAGFDVSDGSLRWRLGGPGRLAGRVALADGRLYATDVDGTLYAYGVPDEA